jgi:hypothetical protein
MGDPKTQKPTEVPVPRVGLMGWISTRGKALYALASLLLLLPVYWLPRVQGGDLSTHFDNAWLSQWIESGRPQGLISVGQTTNVLFDLILGGLYRLVGAELAQRLSVSLAVLTFVWGAFAFVAAVGGRKPWHMFPCIAMLAYGWVFHMGFYNFYLSLGLCFWALSVAWTMDRRRAPMAAALLFLAYFAHAMPVVWTLGLLGFLWLANRTDARRRVFVTAAWLLATVLVNALVSHSTPAHRSVQPIDLTTGASPVWGFDGKYYFVLVGLLLIWGLLFVAMLRKSGAGSVVSGVPFQLCLISAAAVFILPSTVLIPGFQHTLVYNAERMSLGVGVCVCAMLGPARPRVFEKYALLVVSLVFFGFLYRDERALNSFEDRMTDTVARLETAFSHQRSAISPRTASPDAAPKAPGLTN